MKRPIVVALTILFLVALGAWLWFRPRFSVRVERNLVGPEDKAMELLWQGATLDEIKGAVQKSGKHVDQISALGGSLLFWAASKGRLDVARWLLEQGADPDGIHPGSRPLKTAVLGEKVAMVRLLVSHGADPDLKTDIAGATIRQLAEQEANPEIVAALPVEEEPESKSTSKRPGGERSEQESK